MNATEAALIVELSKETPESVASPGLFSLLQTFVEKWGGEQVKVLAENIRKYHANFFQETFCFGNTTDKYIYFTTRNFCGVACKDGKISDISELTLKFH